MLGLVRNRTRKRDSRRSFREGPAAAAGPKKRQLGESPPGSPGMRNPGAGKTPSSFLARERRDTRGPVMRRGSCRKARTDQIARLRKAGVGSGAAARVFPLVHWEFAGESLSGFVAMSRVFEPVAWKVQKRGRGHERPRRWGGSGAAGDGGDQEGEPEGRGEAACLRRSRVRPRVGRECRPSGRGRKGLRGKATLLGGSGPGTLPWRPLSLHSLPPVNALK